MSRLSRGRKLLREQLGDVAQSYGIGRVAGAGAEGMNETPRVNNRLKNAVNSVAVPAGLDGSHPKSDSWRRAFARRD